MKVVTKEQAREARQQEWQDRTDVIVVTNGERWEFNNVQSLLWHLKRDDNGALYIEDGGRIVIGKYSDENLRPEDRL
jgi:hypothetical protein